MKFFEKLLNFFRKTRDITRSAKLKISTFVTTHKEQIYLIMKGLELLFPPKKGFMKMGCVVANVCVSLGLSEISDDVRDYVEQECQKVYDEFKDSLKA